MDISYRGLVFIGINRSRGSPAVGGNNRALVYIRHCYGNGLNVGQAAAVGHRHLYEVGIIGAVISGILAIRGAGKRQHTGSGDDTELGRVGTAGNAVRQTGALGVALGIGGCNISHRCLVLSRVHRRRCTAAVGGNRWSFVHIRYRNRDVLDIGQAAAVGHRHLYEVSVVCVAVGGILAIRGADKRQHAGARNNTELGLIGTAGNAVRKSRAFGVAIGIGGRNISHRRLVLSRVDRRGGAAAVGGN